MTVVDSSNVPRAKVQLAVRIPRGWLTRLDALIPKIAQEGVQTTRTDAIRVALAKGLDLLESARARAKATRRATEVALAKGLDSLESSPAKRK